MSEKAWHVGHDCQRKTVLYLIVHIYIYIYMTQPMCGTFWEKCPSPSTRASIEIWVLCGLLIANPRLLQVRVGDLHGYEF